MMEMQAVQLTESEKLTVKIKARKTLLWFGIISIVMLFAALTSAYIVRQGEGKWAQFDLPQAFIFSTLAILLSSIPMQWAVSSAKKGNRKNQINALLATLILGLAFVGLQYLAWSELFDQGIAFAGKIKDIKADFTYIKAGKESNAEILEMGNVAGSFLYVITALHVVHLVGGLIALIVVLSRASLGKYSPENYSGLSMCATYWHFLGGLWVYLFFFLLYIR
jgi:cytochrome c oxidase subunit 3